MFCVNKTGDRVAFLDGEYINEYHLDSKAIKSATHRITETPIYMNYMDSDRNYVFVVYDKAAVKYDMRGRYDCAIYERNDLSFSVKGCFGGNKLLLFDEDCDCYEWDIDKDIIPLKYKHHNMAALGVYLNKTCTELIVPFDNDSIVFIDVDNAGLNNALYYGERETNAGMCLYDKTRDSFMMLLENDSYEFIKNFDVQSCEYKRSYYDFVDKHKIRSMEVSARSGYLLCAFDKKVSIIDLDTLSLLDVYTASNGEQIRTARYHGEDDILIVLCEATHVADALLGSPRIYELQKTMTGSYRKSASYKPPYVPLDMLDQYVTDTNITFGIDSSGGMNLLCLGTGIFLKRDVYLNSVLTIDKHIWNEAGKEIIVKYTPKINEFFYICYDESFDFNKTLLNISEDFSSAVASELESQRLAVLELNGDGDAYIEIKTIVLNDESVGSCVTGNDSRLFCLGSENNAFSLDLLTGVKREYPVYTPGLVVIGCDFTGADMSDTVRDLLALHGSVV